MMPLKFALIAMMIIGSTLPMHMENSVKVTPQMVNPPAVVIEVVNKEAVPVAPAPVAPVTPIEPVAPVTPVAPVAPVVPVAPV